MTALQHRLLGYIHFQRCSVEKSFERDYKDCYVKARLYNPTIFINPDFDPESSLSRKILCTSADKKKKSHQTSDLSEVTRSWPEIANPRRKKDDCLDLLET